MHRATCAEADAQDLTVQTLSGFIMNAPGVYCETDSTMMEKVQVVLDKKLLQATDQAARRMKRNRSALVRDALREHLRNLDLRAREQSDREGYLRQPPAPDESRAWEEEAAWPAK